jgi:hypothetical protein
MKKPPINNQKRQEEGSTLVMTLCVGALLVFICVIAFSFYMLLSENKRSKGRAEQMAVDMAKILNEEDRVGQLNNTMIRSRELVYLSRQCEGDLAQKNLDNWEPLARLLVEEARSGAELVEAERKNQIEVTKKAVRYFADYKNVHTVDKPVFNMPFFKTWDAEIAQIDLGYVANTQSNVLNTEVYPALREYDESHKYFQKGSNLYMGNINAKLPEPDNDLDFKLAGLAAPVGNTIAPARLISQRSFKQVATVFKNVKPVDAKIDTLPTALRDTELVWITAASQDEEQMQVAATAATSGALPPPESTFHHGNDN